RSGREDLLVADRLRHVEDDATETRHARRQLDEERAVAAADVDDGLARAPRKPCDPLDTPSLPVLHREVERLPLLRVLGEPAPEVAPERPRERGPHGARVEVADGAIPGSAEETGELARGLAALQGARRVGVGEHAGIGLGEDAVARERA